MSKYLLRQKKIIILGFIALLFSGVLSSQIEAKENIHLYMKRLFPSLNSQFADKRAWAVNQFGRIGKQCLDFLIQKYPKQNYRVRREIVSILGKFSSVKTHKQLFICLHDPDYGVRNRASLALLAWCSPKNKSLIKKIKKLKKDPKYTQNITVLLNSIYHKLVENELAKLVSPQGGFGFFKGQFKPMMHLGSDAVFPLLNIFRKSKYRFVNVHFQKDADFAYKLRYMAGQALGEFKHYMGRNKRVVINELRHLVRTLVGIQNSQLREIAVTSLYFLGEKYYVDRQIRILKRKIRINRRKEDNYSELGMLYLRIQKEKEGLDMLQKAIRCNPHNALTYYNLACAYSCLGQINKALDALETSVRKGYDDVKWIQKDGDLRTLHNQPRFKKLVKKLKEKLDKRKMLGG